MTPYQSPAARLRMLRLHRHGDDRLFVVPLDHSVADGPITAGNRLDPLVSTLADNGADAVVLHKGRVPYVDPRRFTGIGLIVHLSASTMHAPDPDAKYLVASVRTAIRLAADAVSVHVNMGSEEERQQIADLGTVADACSEWNIPLLAMMYPRGPRVENPRDPALLAHAASLATDLGADIVKIPWAETQQEMADVVRGSALPVITAGGSPDPDPANVLAHVSRLLDAGTAGVAMGRNIFEAPDPGGITRRVADVVHPSPAAPVPAPDTPALSLNR
ncbi:2-amino-4,5-dihydroxy-6-oxo-7-(phosphonooxy)heptanoate synthase [Haloactinospora alba]|uniref:2-amino-4, 5-dihydroxy-6-oxo-7-(Phosphonooxy)heptanoate synthase n=1 Tax=Haloactinospora alba TaxID=405555 RepID=A0A543N8X9_9ACTN|nr:2-amino-3,7-dideoxy-D-threo-hept-6-ulosonate synthase [Haloactinospora alba]TQN28277.1 2-amino-4,5-dihydroxy-6-oxo-7-(phosphonooxy)heptanoate synthase [Haloactinospora alba]